MTTGNQAALYEQDNIRVTATHVSAGGRSYPLAEMHSASLDQRSNRRIYGWVVLLVGAAILIAGYLAWRTILPPLIGGGALLLAGAALIATAPRGKVVKIRDQAGAVVAVPVPDEATGHRLIEAVDQARLGGRERAVGS
jgi:hypothetical protein